MELRIVGVAHTEADLRRARLPGATLRDPTTTSALHGTQGPAAEGRKHREAQNFNTTRQSSVPGWPLPTGGCTRVDPVVDRVAAL
jgi:hypothetical protein